MGVEQAKVRVSVCPRQEPTHICDVLEGLPYAKLVLGSIQHNGQFLTDTEAKTKGYGVNICWGSESRYVAKTLHGHVFQPQQRR